MIRKTLRATAVLSLVFLLACGEQIITGARIAFASAKPVIDRQVTKGTITKELGDAIKADIGDAIDAAARAQVAFKSIPSGLSKAQKLIEQAGIYNQLAQELKAIRDRHHAQGNAVLEEIASIISDVIAALEEFYRNVVTVPAAEARGEVSPQSSAGTPADPEKQLERAMKSAQSRMHALNAQK